MKKTSHTFHFPLSLGEGAGVRLYFQQALYHLRENPVISWISVLGTALSICMIMVIVITLRVRIADCEPEVNRSRSLYVPNMSYRALLVRLISYMIDIYHTILKEEMC